MSSQPEIVLVGTPFSTFTRTIAISLHFKHIKFTQVSTRPHSEKADESHPFGFLPTLVVGGVKLRESQAIARWIDREFPDPPLIPSSIPTVPNDPTPHGINRTDKMWELVSLIASHGFPAIEAKVVKPRVAHTDAGNDPSAPINLDTQLDELGHFLSIIEDLMTSLDPEGFPETVTPTWADFFLYPLLADLVSIREGECVNPRLREWMVAMEEVRGVKETSEGTLSKGARPQEG